MKCCADGRDTAMNCIAKVKWDIVFIFSIVFALLALGYFLTGCAPRQIVPSGNDLFLGERADIGELHILRGANSRE